MHVRVSVCLSWGWLVALALASACANVAPATGGTGTGGGTQTEDAALSAPFTCDPCITRADCGTRWCVQFASDTFCAVDCSASGCATGLTCRTLITEAGESVQACVPEAEQCTTQASDATSGATDTSGSGVDPASCGYTAPEQPGCCKACTSGANCQANGCFGGWYCESSSCKCVAASAAVCVDGGATEDTGPLDAGSTDTAITPGSLTAAGGEVPELFFAIVGDTRPALIDDTKGFPSAIAKKIWQGVAQSGAPFTITTGDYMFATGWGTQGSPQLDLYLAAAAPYQGLRLPALGNHECTGATTSNCGAGNKDGLTKNYTSFLAKMLAPLGIDKPYFAFHVHAPDNSWSAKFVFIAANAWDATQAAWLDAELAKPTTYTFAVRHEPVAADTAPGVKPSEAVLAKHPLTIRLVGHTHTYVHHANEREVVVGNGGAPLSGASNYGYVLVKRRADGAIQFDAYDYSSGQATSTFAVQADGSAAP